jgi:hypothetical protein
MNMLKLWLCAAGFAAVLGGSGQALAYGALAIDHNQGPAYGASYDHETMRQAERAALRKCGHDCQIVLRIESGCGAYAADQAYGSTVFGYAFHQNGERAQRRAMRLCREYGGTRCQVRAWACNSY